MVLLTRPGLRPEGLWRARKFPWALRYLIIAVAVVGNGLTAWRVWNQGPYGFGTVELELTLCVVDVLLWTTLALTPSRAWIATVLLQMLLLVTEVDPGSFTLEILVLLGLLGYGAARHALIIPVVSTVLWVLLLPLIATDAATGFISGYIALMITSLVIGLSLRYLASRREEDAATIADFELSTKEALSEQRNELARELHDIVAHDLTVIAMQASAGAMQADGEREREAFTVVGTSARSALDDLRLLLRIMREPRTEEGVEPAAAGIDLATEVSTLAANLEELGHDVTTQVAGDLSAVPDGVRTTVRKVLREGTTNILKHGAARADVTLSMAVKDGVVVTTVTNTLSERPDRRDGRNFGRSGFGLIGLRERVQLLSGQLEAGVGEDRQFRLAASLPLNPST